MGDYVFTRLELSFFEGIISNQQYEFVHEAKKGCQKNISFFILQLNPEVQIQKEYDIKQDTEVPNHKSDLIAGVIHGDLQFTAERIKDYLMNSINQNIYFRLGLFKEGFKNIINTAYDLVYSADSLNNKDNKEGIVHINMFMRVQNEIYLSNHLQKSEEIPTQNIWKILIQGENKLRDIENSNDLIYVCEEFYQIKPDITKLLNQIFMTSTNCPRQNTFLSIRQQNYSRVVVQNPALVKPIQQLYFLRLGSLNGENSGLESEYSNFQVIRI